MFIAIAVLSGRDHNPYFTKSLVEFVSYLAHQKQHSYLTMFRSNVSNIASGRQRAVDEAMAAGCTHLLFLDDDMVFPQNMLDTMIKSGCPVTALNAVRKLPGKLSFCTVDFKGNEVSSVLQSGHQLVRRAGTGIMLIELAALKDIPKPYFEQRYDAETGKFHGEDYYFCDRLYEWGVPLCIDHTASQDVGHIGDYCYGIMNGNR